MQSIASSSTLKPAVENLIRLIFDVQKMKDAMLEFELDLQKMPLGKLSKNQIRNAYSVLSDALAAISLPENEQGRTAKILEASNKYVALASFSVHFCILLRFFPLVRTIGWIRTDLC